MRLDDGLEMHYRTSIGPAPPNPVAVVLVHGFVVSSRYLVPLGEHLAPDFRVYAPDLPGFGRSDKPPQTLSIDKLAHALAAWMQAIGLERAHLIGNSMSCNILVEFAVHHPHLVDRLVLQGPTTDPRARSTLSQAIRWLQNALREPPQPGLMIKDYATTGLRSAFENFRYLLDHRIEERLPSVQAPTLVVRGTRDPIVPQGWACQVTTLLPRGRLIEIPGAAHTINLYAPLEFTRVLRPFLIETTRGSTAA
ncbi:alpha/beta fold hydrolase [Virgifigura deserti]|uniref:alpha/beta fold hydrolase n=1 Tax=Virgifigura deserti TaxID=2268457 RepID=UPI003CCB9C24